MLRRAKSVDIPFMVKGYEIGLRDGNFSESKMQINAFFANTTTHKNVHSYIYENNNVVSAYAILRKKDAKHHEIMMMFVDPAQQGNGIGKKFLETLLSGPMKDSPILCSTTQPASTRMMSLLKGLGFQRKAEAVDGVYWEKPNIPGALSTTETAPAPTRGQPLSGMAPSARLALPITDLLLPAPETEIDGVALEQATQVARALPPGYRSALPSPEASPPVPVVIEGEAIETLPEPNPASKTDPAPDAQALPAAPVTEAETKTAPETEVTAALPEAATPIETLPAVIETAAVPEVPPQESANLLPKPPIDFSGKTKSLGYESRQQRARQLAKELFETLKGNEAESEKQDVTDAAPPIGASEITPDTLQSEEDIPLLATLNVVREKMGSLPGVKLPPLDRYRLMELNKKDLENMNVVELAALSSQLVKLAKDQLEEIDRLKIATQKRR